MTYPGGKNGTGVYQRIINHMPPHRVYIEPFLGSGAVLRAKKPASSNIGIDADADVITNFSVDVTNLMLLQANALDWLASHAVTNDTLIYLDPPYLLTTRRQHRQIYRYELTETDHVRLLDIIKALPCMVMLSGYWSQLYTDALKDWRTDHFTTTTRGGSRATEWLWMNFPMPFQLHDYRYLGTNFRERERIKRKCDRWERRLRAMPTLERYAILSAISEIEAPGNTTNNGDAAGAIVVSDEDSSQHRRKQRWPRPSPDLAMSTWTQPCDCLSSHTYCDLAPNVTNRAVTVVAESQKDKHDK